MLDGKPKEIRRYAAPDAADLAREAKVLELLRGCFADWQREGFIPSMVIPEAGDETARLYRERGWAIGTNFSRHEQLLTHGLLAELSSPSFAKSKTSEVGCLLGLGRMANWDSRLCRWVADKSKEGWLGYFFKSALNAVHFQRATTSKFSTAWPSFQHQWSQQDSGAVKLSPLMPETSTKRATFGSPTRLCRRSQLSRAGRFLSSLGTTSN